LKMIPTIVPLGRLGTPDEIADFGILNWPTSAV